jgi:uridine monophosphate synthetase
MKEIGMGFFSKIEERALEVNSLLCVGLDPHPGELSSFDPKEVQNFCSRLIEATNEFVLAYKPNIAFFEVHGDAGLEILKLVIDSIPEDIPIILDAKRGDIASSANAYAQAAFDTFGVDAITVNPYLGYDSLEPFLQDENKGVFLLCKTSNPGAADIQDLKIIPDPEMPISDESAMVYEVLASKAVDWNKSDNLGLVVGATQPSALSNVRYLAPDLWILAPGVGAQGGNLQDALDVGLRPDGLGMVVPVSRGISQASDPREAAQTLNNAINQIRKQGRTLSQLEFPTSIRWETGLRDLAIDLLETGCVKFGDFKLKSGLISPIYIDLRRLVGYPDLLIKIAKVYLKILRELRFDHIAAVPYAGLPIASTIGIQGGLSLVYPRKEIKSYGTQAKVEGIYSFGDQVVLIDDLATTGGSKFEAIDKLESVGLIIKDVVVLIDRQSGASEDLADKGFQLHAIYTLSKLLNDWYDAKLISSDQVRAVKDFISSSQASSENRD